MNFQDFDKLKTSLRYWLMGRNYTQAVRAMEFGLSYHTGKRKNGDPEFIHQLSQVQYARTLENHLVDPEGTFVTIFLHDIVEDHDGTTDYINMVGDERASFAKGCDRLHNFGTMGGVFSPEKQMRYTKECMDHIIPMLKLARTTHVEQEAAYHNVKHVLMIQMELVARMNEGKIVIIDE